MSDVTKKLNLQDKNGIELHDDCIVYGCPPNESEKHYFNLGVNWKGEIEMIASSYGYLHNVTQEIMNNFEYKGTVEDNLHLLSCPC